MVRTMVSVSIASLLACGSTALAVDVNPGDYLRFTDGPGTTVTDRRGGEFIAQVHRTGETFRTFCLERSENIFFGSASASASGGDPTRSHPFAVTGVSDRAMLGGIDLDEPDEPGDPISSRTAFLYQNFVLGTLDGYVYGADSDPARIASADALQNAIWYLEHEISDRYFGITDPATMALIDHFLTMDMGGFTGTGLVRVLNIVYRWDGPGGAAGERGQDVLVLVPLPHAAGMGLVGLLGVAGVTRRRR